MGILHGVTTSPEIIVGAHRPMDELLSDLLKVQSGPIAVQVVASTSEMMIQQAENLFSFSNHIIIKIPVTCAGLVAIHQLANQGIPIMATWILWQIALAAKVGAQHIAFYCNYLDLRRGSQDIHNAIVSIRRTIDCYTLNVKLLGSAIKTLDQIMLCIENGIDAITCYSELFQEIVADRPKTLQIVERLQKAWSTAEYDCNFFNECTLNKI